jgi:hypothetical protein
MGKKRQLIGAAALAREVHVLAWLLGSHGWREERERR